MGHASEISSGERFAFGKNRRGFLSRLDEGAMRLLRPLLFLPVPICFEAKRMAAGILHGKVPFSARRKQRGRGMSPCNDWFDRPGGYPFEVARPEEIAGFPAGRASCPEKT